MVVERTFNNEVLVDEPAPNVPQTCRPLNRKLRETIAEVIDRSRLTHFGRTP
jgi:hypothetical protein